MVKEKPRNSGLGVIGDVPWGTHFCQFYRTEEDLMEILVPYFKAGLENNELCVWITPQSPGLEESKEALEKHIPDIDVYLDKKQIEIISYTELYFKDGIFSPEKTLESRVGKLNYALASGYEGLRLAEDTLWLKEIDLRNIDYEKEVDRITRKCRIIALCAYPLEKCSATGIMDIITDHQFSLIKKEGEWELVENSRYKKTEETEILANILELTDDAIITQSLDGIITGWNKGAERIYGYLAKEILGKPLSILDPPILVEETEELNELTRSEERIHHYETLRLRKDGKIINVLLTFSSILDAFGNPAAVLTIARDTTEGEQTAKKILKSKEIYRIITEQTGQLVYDYDLRADRCTWAGAIEEVTGYSFEEFQRLGKYVWTTNIYSVNTNHQIVKVFRDMEVTEDKYKEELMLRRKDGTYIEVENKGIYLKNHEGCPYEAIGVIKDITDWKLTLNKVKESEEKYRSFIKNFQGIVYQSNENFIPVYMHGAVEEVTGYKERDFSSRIKWKEIIHPDDLPLVLKEEEKVRNFQSTGYGNVEYRIKQKDGRVRWVHEIYQKIKKNEEREFYQGTIYDVTERKETEKFLKNIETARKKEIHHRIKNNLQVISSLLDLQAEKFKNKGTATISEVLEAFKENQNRIVSMSLIHEELHKGARTDTLNFSAYLQKLAENLLETYSLKDENLSLHINLEENAFFDMDIAVPLGIIVNELVSNSLKYAFPGDKEGEIRINLCKEKEDNETNKSLFSLTISDNGIGIPENIELGNVESLGLQLVSILVDQLDGEIKLNRDKGTEFIITFEVTDGL